MSDAVETIAEVVEEIHEETPQEIHDPHCQELHNRIGTLEEQVNTLIVREIVEEVEEAQAAEAEQEIVEETPEPIEETVITPEPIVEEQTPELTTIEPPEDRSKKPGPSGVFGFLKKIGW